MNTYTYEEIVNKYNEDVALEAMSKTAEPTSRYIYPAFEPEHAGKNEWLGEPVKVDNDSIRACYYFSDEEEADLDNINWENYVEFIIEEL